MENIGKYIKIVKIIKKFGKTLITNCDRKNKRQSEVRENFTMIIYVYVCMYVYVYVDINDCKLICVCMEIFIYMYIFLSQTVFYQS